MTIIVTNNQQKTRKCWPWAQVKDDFSGARELETCCGIRDKRITALLLCGLKWLKPHDYKQVGPLMQGFSCHGFLPQ